MPSPAAGRGAGEGARLRRLPHGPARGRGGAAGPEAAARPRPSDRRDGGAVGEGVEALAVGDRVGVPWLGGDGRQLPLLPQRAREPLRRARRSPATSSTAATPSTLSARADFVLPLPEGYPDVQAAPLLCAGLIGYRALRLTELEEPGGGRRGLACTGSALSAHRDPGRAHLGHEVYVCTRGERRAAFARGAGRRVGGRRGRASARGARQRDHLRPRRFARLRLRCGRCEGRQWWFAPAST